MKNKIIIRNITTDKKIYLNNIEYQWVDCGQAHTPDLLPFHMLLGL